MSGRWRTAALPLVVGLAGPAVWFDAGQDTVFRGGVDVVTVGVSVTRDDRPVTGLGLKDFTLTDNGVPQQITGITYESQPIDLTVLLDVSESVTGAILEQLRTAVSDLGPDLRAHDRLRVLTFSMYVQRILDIDAAQTVTGATFATAAPAGSSAVLDALAVALVSPTASDRRQFIVLFSDGTENASITSPAELLNVARRTTPTISVVLAVPYREAPHGVYRDLALETGGTVVSLGPDEPLGGKLRAVLDDFRSSYVLTYSPSGVSVPGSHTIDVFVDLSGVTVRARRGYTAR